MCRLRNPACMVERWKIRPNTNTYQSHATGEDHDDDEGLKVVVLYQREHVTTELPVSLAEHRVLEDVKDWALFDAQSWTAVVRVLDEDDVHLVYLWSV